VGPACVSSRLGAAPLQAPLHRPPAARTAPPARPSSQLTSQADERRARGGAGRERAPRVALAAAQRRDGLLAGWGLAGWGWGGKGQGGVQAGCGRQPAQRADAAGNGAGPGRQGRAPLQRARPQPPQGRGSAATADAPATAATASVQLTAMGSAVLTTGLAGWRTAGRVGRAPGRRCCGRGRGRGGRQQRVQRRGAERSARAAKRTARSRTRTATRPPRCRRRPGPPRRRCAPRGGPPGRPWARASDLTAEDAFL
jgi:hypothetical protein